MNLVDVYTIHEMGHRSTDAVPLVSLVGKHALMGIQHEVDHLISGRGLETLAEPIDCHLSGCHRVKHEILQVLQGLWVGESGFVHAPIISTGFDGSLGSVCHLANWLGQLTQLFITTLRRVLNTAIQNLMPEVYSTPVGR